MLSLPCQICYIIWLIFIIANAQLLINIKPSCHTDATAKNGALASVELGNSFGTNFDEPTTYFGEEKTPGRSAAMAMTMTTTSWMWRPAV